MRQQGPAMEDSIRNLLAVTTKAWLLDGDVEVRPRVAPWFGSSQVLQQGLLNILAGQRWCKSLNEGVHIRAQIAATAHSEFGQVDAKQVARIHGA